MKVISAIACNIGKIRENNEDNFYYNGKYLYENERDIPCFYDGNSKDDLQFYAVCDGMGGEAHGEEASLIAVEVLSKYHKKLSDRKYHSLDRYMDMYFSEVNSQISEVRTKYSNFRSGTTIAMVIVEDETIHIVNIGDSRVYKLKNNNLYQISEDHTPAVRAYMLGAITKDEIKTHPHRNKLTQYLGLGPDEFKIVPTRVHMKARDNDRFLICSDGVTDMVSDKEIETILRAEDTPKGAVKVLVDRAMQNGGRDNITAIVLDIKKDKKFLWF